MHFVKDHQLVEVVGQVELGLGQFGAVGLGFEVEGDCQRARADGLAHRERQRGLANLPRPEQGHGRRVRQGIDDGGLERSVKHPCNYGVKFPNCKVESQAQSTMSCVPATDFSRARADASASPPAPS